MQNFCQQKTMHKLCVNGTQTYSYNFLLELFFLGKFELRIPKLFYKKALPPSGLNEIFSINFEKKKKNKIIEDVSTSYLPICVSMISKTNFLLT
jgi:hypothetical protein